MKDLITNYILTVKDFKSDRLRDTDIIINSGEALRGDYPCEVVNTPSDPLQLYNNEITAFRWILANPPSTDYISIQHYRRYWEYIPSADELKGYDIVLPTHMIFNLRQQYAACHDIRDLEFALGIVRELFPDIDCSFIDGNIFYPCNISLQRTEDFLRYAEFLVTVIDEFARRRGYSTLDDIDKDSEYQKRIGGFVAERLGTIYFLNNYKRIKEVNICKI